MLSWCDVRAPVEISQVVKCIGDLLVADHLPEFGDVHFGGDVLALLAEFGDLLVAIGKYLRGEDNALGGQAGFLLAADRDAHTRRLHINHPRDGDAPAHPRCNEFSRLHASLPSSPAKPVR